MRILLDTQVLLWCFAGDKRLGRRTRALVLAQRNDIAVSVVSAWEIGIKSATGQVLIPEPWDRVLAQQIDECGFRVLPISLDHVFAIRGLPPIHQDPFDRMLLAQAATEGRILFTADQNNLRYPVRCHDAQT